MDKNKDHEKKRNDHQPKKLWLLKKFSLSVPKDLLEKNMKNRDTGVRVNKCLQVVNS